ncbi:MAG TPA: enoyl-CoA hydratase/isomerase family protein [Thermoanaerobaculia bacterium]|nr:enoyl-CoA hydratase/isomerase family protein [Thermoanaerobaculia bacterium]HUM30753.1 enoyl-CoA hydratase/isomerase family protein [Thermoanaerobaculia bacterium]HXK68958.1 enoyl-CoA hydratase/isomerase family protein [Thermoanaerobaculia bacterium]
MEDPVVQIEQRGEALRLRLNRPRAFNALNSKMIASLSEALDRAVREQPRLLIYTGSGRFFCFGVDFQHMKGEDIPSMVQSLLPEFQNVIRTLHVFPAPTICILNGHAAGAGLDLALAADFRIAVPGIKLSEAFVRWGLVPDGGGSLLLPRLVGLSRARRMALTGEAVPSETALDWGLIDEIVPEPELNHCIARWTETLSSLPREAYLSTRRLLNHHGGVDLDQALTEEAVTQKERLQSQEFRKILDTGGRP